MSPPPPAWACSSVPFTTDQPFSGNSVLPMATQPLVVLPSKSSFQPSAFSAEVSVLGSSANAQAAKTEKAATRGRNRGEIMRRGVCGGNSQHSKTFGPSMQLATLD
jgi:hypothetical protein